MTTDKETFKLIIKDLRKCDSLKVAYVSQSITLDSLIIDNRKMFSDFVTVRDQKSKLQKDLDEKEEYFNKIFQRPNRGWIVPLAVGVVTGILISK